MQPTQTNSCPYCGEPLDNPRRVQCGKFDCKQQWQRDRMRKWQRRYRAEHGQWYTRKWSKRTESRTCPVCGKQWETTEVRKVRYCSTTCANRDKMRDRRVPAIRILPPLRRPLPLTPRRLRRCWHAGYCIECGAAFVTDNSRNTKTCSRVCSSRWEGRQAKYARRARVKGGPWVRRREVFERDGWRCQRCKRKVNRNAVVPHPRAPTLDHIIPLANGGRHEPANVQTAHYECNWRKSNRLAGDQLRLFA